jgi:hypothetical protein
MQLLQEILLKRPRVMTLQINRRVRFDIVKQPASLGSTRTTSEISAAEAIRTAREPSPAPTLRSERGLSEILETIRCSTLRK